MAEAPVRSQGSGFSDSPQEPRKSARCDARPGVMRPKTAARPSPRPGNSHQPTTMRSRNYCKCQRPHTQATVTTEYQDRFLPPCHFRTFIMSQKPKDAQNSLRNVSLPTFKRTTDHQRSISAPQYPVGFALNRLASRTGDFSSVYQNDFRAWKANRCLPYTLSQGLKPDQGLGLTHGTCNNNHNHSNFLQGDTISKPAKHPFESMTSYRSDYVAHPVPPRTRKNTFLNKPSREPPSENSANSLRRSLAWQTDQQPRDRGGELSQPFQTWPLENRADGQGKDHTSRSPADLDTYLSTTHAAYVPHKCERTRPILPCVHSGEKIKEPFLPTTTMKEDYKAWDIPQSFLARNMHGTAQENTLFNVHTSDFKHNLCACIQN